MSSQNNWLSVDRSLTIHVPAYLVAKYALDQYRRAKLYRNEGDQTFAIVFTNSRGKGTWPFGRAKDGGIIIHASGFFGQGSVRLGQLPARFPYKVLPAKEVGIDEPGEAFVVELSKESEVTNPDLDPFFERLSEELARRKDGILTVDEDLTVHFPVGVLARYDLHAGIEGYWNDEHAAFVMVFTKKSGERKQATGLEQEIRSIPGKEFFAEFRIDLGKRPAQFAYIIESPTFAFDREVSGDEAIIVPLQWRQ